MKNDTQVREILISNAIHLVAKGGFEKATTKELAFCGDTLPGFKMNEVYIYRLFGSKDKLFETAFLRLDDELFFAYKNAVSAMGDLAENTRGKFYEFFLRAWNFLFNNEDKCRYYVRYYYSVYFHKEVRAAHKLRFMEVISPISHLFLEEADSYAIMHSVFTLLFDFAIRVYNGEIENDEINVPHIFNVLYQMMVIYFKASYRES